MSAGFHVGLGVSAGIAIGQAFLLHAEPLPVVPEPVPPERLEDEVERFALARAAASAELTALETEVREVLGGRYAGIFDAQRLMLDDPALIAETVQRIRRGRVSARWALKEAVGVFLRRFDRIDDPDLRERVGELSDVHRRLQRLLRGETTRGPAKPAGALVVVAHAVGPSDAMLLAGEGVVGLATDVGGRTSHTAILAQALSLPAVVGLQHFSRSVRAGETILLDGETGEVVRSPDAARLAAAEGRRQVALDVEASFAGARDVPAVTRTGIRVSVRANIEFAHELERARRFGAEGIGLYRSEFLFLSRAPDLPDEEEHHRTYATLARSVAPHPAVVRTLDLGGEKYFHDVLARDEPNPVLGLRAVRFCLGRPDVFRPQLRGLLRAAAECDNLRIMLPLVTGVTEIRQVREWLAEEAAALRARGIPVRADVPLGVMIEVPAAAMAADRLAAEADFLSVGTNDLIQYALAVDRGNEAVAYLYDPLHPGVLRMIGSVVEAGERHGCIVSVCGEMAAQREAIGLLLGLGVRELSVQPGAVGAVREAVRQIDVARTLERARELLGAPEADAMERRFASST